MYTGSWINIIDIAQINYITLGSRWLLYSKDLNLKAQHFIKIYVFFVTNVSCWYQFTKMFYYK